MLTIAQKQAKLEEYQHFIREMKDAEERYQEISELIESVTAAKMSDMPIHRSEETDKLAVRLIAFEKLKRKRVELINMFLDVENAILDIKNSEVRRVMRLRYIKCLLWSDIAKQMICCEDKCYRLHRVGLKRIEFY